MTTTTWNPSDKSAGITLSGGNLVATGSASPASVRSTASRLSKYYFEVTATTAGSNMAIGIADATYSLGEALGAILTQRATHQRGSSPPTRVSPPQLRHIQTATSLALQ